MDYIGQIEFSKEAWAQGLTDGDKVRLAAHFAELAGGHPPGYQPMHNAHHFVTEGGSHFYWRASGDIWTPNRQRFECPGGVLATWVRKDKRQAIVKMLAAHGISE